MNSDEKLKIEFIESVSASIFILFGFSFIVMVCLSIYCTLTHSTTEFGAVPFIIILLGTMPWYFYGYYISYTIECSNLYILYSIMIVFLTITIVESIFYTFLYYRKKNTYKIISTNGKKVGFLKVFMRNILKSINRQILYIGFIPIIFGKNKLLYDTILNTDITSKDEYK